MQAVKHEFEPIYNKDSRILILGTFPSVKSREVNFYYGHPQNRFWEVVAKISNETVPNTIEEKKEMLLNNHIAIWDVIASCDIEGSSDSSIRNVVPNDIMIILKSCNIRKIYANGNMAKKLYDRYVKEKTGLDIVELPSTSPANAIFTKEKLVVAWDKIFNREEKTSAQVHL